MSYLKLGTISALTDDNEQKINFSSFNNIIQHSNNYIVNSDSRIFVDFSTFSNNTRSIDFEITLLAVGRPILQYIEKLAAKKDSWFQEHLSEKDNQLLKVLAKKKTISKERKKAIKRLKRLTELNAEQSSKLDELTLLNTELQTEINSKSFFHKQDFEQEKQLNTQLGLQLTSKENQLEAEQQKCHQLNLELQKEKQRLTELSQQIKIEQQKQQALLNDLQDEKRKLDPFNKIIADHEKVLVEKSSLIKEFKKKSKKQKKAFADLKLNEDSLKSEALQLQSKLNNTLSTTEKYKSEVTELQNLSEKRNDVIQKQHLEILKFKRDYAALENYNTALKQSKSYKLGRFFTAPFRYIHDLIFDSNLVKNRSWIYFGAFFILLRYPFRFLRHANSNNMATLKKAIKNEPPKQILNNLKNLVVTGKSKPVGIVNQVEVSNSTSPAYMSKWDTFLKNKEIAKSSSRSKILYISPELPQYYMSSGGKRATRMLSLLAEEMEVLVYTTGVKAEKYINKLEENGVRVVINPDIDSLRNKIAHFDSIIFAWYYSYLETHRFTELYPNAKIIVDSVDVHWVREERSIGNWEGFTAEMAAKNKEGEVYTYQQADIVWAVTDNDKAAINNEIPGKDIRVISNIHTPIVNEYIDPQNNNMLFFGGFSHYPNISAVKMLVHQILPLIQKEIPDCKVIIAGSNATQEIKELGQVRGVEFRGFIEEEDVTALYNETFLSVSPLLAGAGIKGKICEAISYMTPVVTNGLGNEGINLENEDSGFIAEEIEALASLIIKAMRREYDMVKITKQAQEKMAHLIGPDIVKERMIASITPEITICIVTYNRMDLLKRCIESIEGNTKYTRYKIVVHSNGCTDGTVQYLEAAAVINKRIIPVLSEENEVFVIPNNNMMMMHEENDVVLLNNDTYVTNNWLTELYNAAYSSSKIGIAGSKILYPDGKLQEFGSELYENGSGRNIGKWENPDLDAYQKMKRAGYVSGCSMYIKRSTIKKLGVFDLQFHPCYCEDSDYCYTAWENDIQTIVTPNSVVYHDEGATSGTDTSSGFKKYQEVNFKKFLQKHKTKLAETQSKIESLNGNPIKLSE